MWEIGGLLSKYKKTKLPISKQNIQKQKVLNLTVLLYIAGFDGFGELMQPANNQMQQNAPNQQKQPMGTGDLDSNLALLAGSITINGAESVKK